MNKLNLLNSNMDNQVQDFFSTHIYYLIIEFQLAGEGKLNFEEITSASIGNILMGDIRILHKVIPQITSANLEQEESIIES